MSNGMWMNKEDVSMLGSTTLLTFINPKNGSVCGMCWMKEAMDGGKYSMILVCVTKLRTWIGDGKLQFGRDGHLKKLCLHYPTYGDTHYYVVV